MDDDGPTNYHYYDTANSKPTHSLHPRPPPPQKEENQAFLEHLITIIPASENIFFFFFQIF